MIDALVKLNWYAIAESGASMTAIHNLREHCSEVISELEKDKEYLDNINNEQTQVILQLNEQIEKMKCCGNCKHYNYCPMQTNKECQSSSNTLKYKWELVDG